MYRCIKNLVTKYLSSPTLVPYEQKLSALNQINLNLSVPCVALKSYGHRAFSCGAVIKWNKKLLLKLRKLPDVDVSKSRFKTNLFKMCYC